MGQEKVLISSYTEDGYKPIPFVRLPDKEYGKGLQCFVFACADIVPIDVKRKVIYLARRQSKPMIGWFWIGGRMEPYETKEEAVTRNFKRETGLAFSQNRFKLTAIFDYRWKDRAQLPQTVGCHMATYTFTVELTSKELVYASRHLDKDEYKIGGGLIPFTREKLISEGVFPAIVDLYGFIFPPTRVSRKKR
ncbi:MAG: NUDIX hydrolase [Candidatus Sungbacteria bacterium]|nr:NUDIX hydrolase [Candidatus Sungbacteria bacterium]